MAAIKVLTVVSEIYPLIKTGGLADVAGALPHALGPHGVKMVTLIPGYPAILAAGGGTDVVLTIDDLFGGAARLIAARVAGLDLLILDAPHLFDRSGSPYSGPDGGDWPDNAFRFGALGWMAARIALGEAVGFVPDIVHGHDWQAGLAMAYLAYDGRRRPATVMTIHNLAYQGQFPAELLSQLRLPPHALTIDGVAHNGAIGFLKAGLQLADRITTVSPTYAKEILTESGGFGLDGLLRWRSENLSGICNGIDVSVWNPKTDARISSRFGAKSLAARTPNKAELQRRFGLKQDPDCLLFGVVSRLTWQKGLDLLANALPALIERGAQLALLGTGDRALEQQLTGLANNYQGTVGCIIGYDEDLAHLIQAGADALLIPSRFEPCGLTQLCAMRYGAIPVATKVGGLADTIVDIGDLATIPKSATGLHFFPATRQAIEVALQRTCELWADRARWRSLQANAMRADVSWAGPAKAYSSLYRSLLVANK